MDLENVDVDILRRALNSCKNRINYNNSQYCIENINNNNIWYSASRDTLDKSLKALIYEKYYKLEDKINKYLLVADKIEEYQNTMLQIDSNNKTINSLNDKLYYDETYEVTKMDSDGNTYIETDVRRVKDYEVEKNINFLTNECENLKQESLRIEEFIYNSI